jgi:DNA-binding MarR family transcriptional regulator
MAQMLARMERDGLIERRVDLTDRRSRTIALRPEAAARLPRAIDAMIEGSRDALHGLTDDEVTQLLALLGRVVDNLDRLTRDAPPTA